MGTHTGPREECEAEDEEEKPSSASGVVVPDVVARKVRSGVVGQAYV